MEKEQNYEVKKTVDADGTEHAEVIMKGDAPKKKKVNSNN